MKKSRKYRVLNEKAIKFRAAKKPVWRLRKDGFLLRGEFGSKYEAKSWANRMGVEFDSVEEIR